MNVEELESIVRDELRRDAANAPSGRQLRATVLDAVAGVPMADRVGRRWMVPLLVAAAVVALAIAATLLPRAFDRHSQPAKPSPKPSPSVSLPAAPTPVGVTCSKSQQLVYGTGARFSDTVGNVGYAYEYYCAGSDGSRTGSTVELFRMVDGRLVRQPTSPMLAGVDEYVMSLTGADGGLVIRKYDAGSGLPGYPGGTVSDEHLVIDPVGETGSGEVVAQPCLAADLTVKVRPANEPTMHEVLRLTNHSHKACAVWGNPQYSWTDKAHAGTARSVVRGPAGGLAAGVLAAPPLLLQPGDTASAAIGSDATTAGELNCSPLTASLANGVRLGELGFDGCHLVSYPLVRADNGSVDHPESEAPPLSTSGSCGVTTNEIALELGLPKQVLGGRIGMVLTVSAHGATTCTIAGFPNVRALDAGGNLEAIAHQQPLAGTSSQQVTVSPGHPASVLVDWARTAASGSCYPDGHLQLTFVPGGYGFNQSMGRFCDLQVHQFVAGSTGGG